MDFIFKNGPAGTKIAIPEFWINERIQKAAKAFNISPSKKIKDLFLVIPAKEAGEESINTKYGFLRVFYSKMLYEMHDYENSTLKILLLDNKKYPYPIENINSKNSKISNSENLIINTSNYEDIKIDIN